MCKKTCSIECHDKRTRLYRRNQLKDLLFGTTIEKMTEPKDWGNSIYFLMILILLKNITKTRSIRT